MLLDLRTFQFDPQGGSFSAIFPWIGGAGAPSDDSETRAAVFFFDIEEEDFLEIVPIALYEDSLEAVFFVMAELEQELDEAEELVLMVTEDAQAAADDPETRPAQLEAESPEDDALEEFGFRVEDVQADDSEARPLSGEDEEPQLDTLEDLVLLVSEDSVEFVAVPVLYDEVEPEEAPAEHPGLPVVEDSIAVTDNPETRAFVFDWEEEETEREPEKIINLLPDVPIVSAIVEWLVRARRRGIR